MTSQEDAVGHATAAETPTPFWRIYAGDFNMAQKVHSDLVKWY